MPCTWRSRSGHIRRIASVSRAPGVPGGGPVSAAGCSAGCSAAGCSAAAGGCSTGALLDPGAARPAAARPGLLGRLLRRGDRPGRWPRPTVSSVTWAVTRGDRRGGCLHRGGRRRRDAGAEAPLDPVDPGGEPALAGVGGGQQQPRAQQLQVHPRAGGTDHLAERGVDDVGGAGELGRPEVGALGLHPVSWSGGTARSTPDGRLPHRLQHDQVAQPLEQVLDEPAGIVAGLDHPVDHAEQRGAVGLAERADDVVEQGAVGVAEQRDGERVVDALRPGAGHQLVEHRQRVAHRPRAGAHDQRHHALADGDALGRAQLLEVGRQRLGRHQPERVVVRAGPDGLRAPCRARWWRRRT